MVNYSGRYLIFTLVGKFLGQVNFSGTSEGFRADMIKLVNVSDSGKYFVFEGPRFLSKKEKEDKKAKKKEDKKKKKEQNKKLAALPGLA